MDECKPLAAGAGAPGADHRVVPLVAGFGVAAELVHPGGVVAGAQGRGLNSSNILLNVSTFCGIRWAHGFPPVY